MGGRVSRKPERKRWGGGGIREWDALWYALHELLALCRRELHLVRAGVERPVAEDDGALRTRGPPSS